MAKNIENYYYSSIYKKKGKNSSSELMKSLFKNLGVSILLVGSLFFYVDNIYLVIITSIIGLSSYYFIHKKIVKKQRKKKIIEIRNKISQEIFWRKVKGMDQYDFLSFIQGILEKLPEFSEIEKTYQDIDFKAKFNNENIVINCHLLDGENAVEASAARSLSRFMNKNSYETGMIITTTDFRDSTKSFCEIIQKKRKIILLAREDLYKMARDAKSLPSDTEIDDTILKRMEYKKRAWKNAQTNLFSKTNLKNYILGGLFLLIFAYFVEGKISFLYYISSILLFSFGFISFWVKVKDEDIDCTWQDKTRL